MAKFRKLVAGAAALTAVAVGFPAHAQETVDVTLDNPGGTRVMRVENMIGEELTSLDFGTGRSLPFRVKVTDSNWARQPFTVNASMTNLYFDTGTSIDYTQQIASSNVALGSQLNPLNVLDVKATVRPLVDTLTTLTGVNATLCTTLGQTITTLTSGESGCELSTNDLVGKIQELNVPVNLTNLANLPLLPQANESGAFTTPEFAAGLGATAPGSPLTAGTQRRLISGEPVSTSTVRNALTAAIDSTPRSDLIDDSTILAGLGSVTSTLSSLTSTQLQTVLDNTVATVNTLTGTDVLSQFGQYISLPTLNVTVPAGTTAGDYKGTLVVTGLQ